MVGGGDWASVGMFGERVWAATEGADHQVGGAAAPVHVVAQAKTPGALREKGAAYERLDGADIGPEEGRWAALHHFQAGPIRVVEGKDDARGVFTWRKVSGISEPTRREKDF